MILALMKPVQFLKEVREELAKVVWPTREQTIKLTAMVIVFTIFAGAFIGILDYILTQITSYLLR